MTGKPLIKANTYITRTKVNKPTIASLPEYSHQDYSQSQPISSPMDLDFMITSSVLFKKRPYNLCMHSQAIQFIWSCIRGIILHAPFYGLLLSLYHIYLRDSSILFLVAFDLLSPSLTSIPMHDFSKVIMIIPFYIARTLGCF